MQHDYEAKQVSNAPYYSATRHAGNLVIGWLLIGSHSMPLVLESVVLKLLLLVFSLFVF
jgi:hypothetical protein